MSRNFKNALHGLKNTFPTPNPKREEEFLQSLPELRQKEKRTILPMLHMGKKSFWYAVPAIVTFALVVTVGIRTYNEIDHSQLPVDIYQETTTITTETVPVAIETDIPSTTQMEEKENSQIIDNRKSTETQTEKISPAFTQPPSTGEGTAPETSTVLQSSGGTVSTERGNFVETVRTTASIRQTNAEHINTTSVKGDTITNAATTANTTTQSIQQTTAISSTTKINSQTTQSTPQSLSGNVTESTDHSQNQSGGNGESGGNSQNPTTTTLKTTTTTRITQKTTATTKIVTDPTAPPSIKTTGTTKATQSTLATTKIVTDPSEPNAGTVTKTTMRTTATTKILIEEPTAQTLRTTTTTRPPQKTTTTTATTRTNAMTGSYTTQYTEVSYFETTTQPLEPEPEPTAFPTEDPSNASERDTSLAWWATNYYTPLNVVFPEARKEQATDLDSLKESSTNILMARVRDVKYLFLYGDYSDPYTEVTLEVIFPVKGGYQNGDIITLYEVGGYSPFLSGNSEECADLRPAYPSQIGNTYLYFLNRWNMYGVKNPAFLYAASSVDKFSSEDGFYYVNEDSTVSLTLGDLTGK